MSSNFGQVGLIAIFKDAEKFIQTTARVQKSIDSTSKSATTGAARTTKAQRDQQAAAEQLAATYQRIDKEIADAEKRLAQVQSDSSQQVINALNAEAEAEKRLLDVQRLRASQGARPRDVTTGRFLSQSAVQQELQGLQAQLSAARQASFQARLPGIQAQNALTGAQGRRANLEQLTAAAPPVKPQDVATITAMAGATKQYEGALEDLEKGATGAASAQNKFVDSVIATAKAAAIALVAYKGFSIIKSIIGDTAELGTQTFQLQQIIGGTSKQVSGLIFGFRQFGIEPKQATTALAIFSRNLALVDENAAGLNTRGQQSTRVLAGLGIKVLDANGKLRPTIDILNDLADTFAKTNNEGLKAGIAAQLFGEQGGRTLLPFLNQGSAGIAKLNAEADRLGLTLDQKTTNAAFKFSQSQKELQQSLKGLEVQVGGAVLPALTALTTAFTDAAPAIGKAMTDAVDAVKDLLDTRLGHILTDFAKTKVAAFVVNFIHEFSAFGNLIGAVFDLFEGDFRGAGKKLVKAASELGKAMASQLLLTFGTVPDAIIGIVEDAINAIIHGINKIPQIKIAGRAVTPDLNLPEVHLPRLGDISGANDLIEGTGKAIKKAGDAAKDANKTTEDGDLALQGFTDEMKRAIEEMRQLSQEFEKSSEAAGQVENAVAKLNKFGIVSKELADKLGLSAEQAGAIQGVDAVIRAQERADREAYNFASTLATVATAFNQSAKVAQDIVLSLARSSLEASKSAVSAITGRPTREVLDQNVGLAAARLQSARVAQAQNPRLQNLQDQLKQFDTRPIDKQLRDLARQQDATDKHFRDLKRAADAQKKAMDRQTDLISQQLDQMKLADLRAQIAYERLNANLERQIEATQQQASDLQKTFLQNNENLQRQINQAIGRGDRATALSLVDQQRQAADAYHRQAAALSNNEDALKLQQKHAKEAEDERQRQEKLAEAELQARKDALDAAKKQLDATTDFTDAENAAKDSLDAQKQALEDQKQAIEDNKQKVQDQIDAVQAIIDASKRQEGAISDNIAVLQAQTDLEKARADAADQTALTQQQQQVALEDLTTQIGISSKAVVDLANKTGQNVVPEIEEAGRQFKLMNGALQVITDGTLRAGLDATSSGFDAVARRSEILAAAKETEEQAVRRLTQAMVTASDTISNTGVNRTSPNLFNLFGRQNPTTTSGTGGSRGLFGIGRSAAGGIYSRFTISSLAEAGPEAVLPLTNPYQARQILAQLPAGLMNTITPRGGAVFSPNITVTGETLETMEAVAIQALQRAFRNARVSSTRAGSLLSSGLGGTG